MGEGTGSVAHIRIMRHHYKRIVLTIKASDTPNILFFLTNITQNICSRTETQTRGQRQVKEKQIEINNEKRTCQVALFVWSSRCEQIAMIC